MRLPGWLFLVLHCAAAYGCLLILARYGGLGLPSGGGWAAAFFFSAAPWISLVTSLIAWLKARQWRRMKAMRTAEPTLSRGQIHLILPDDGPTIFERLSMLSLLLAGITVAHRLGWAEPQNSLGFLLTFWLILKLARASLSVR